MPEKQLFVVLGVHRGGTSLAAAALSSVGVPFGDNMLAADANNPTGYWEDREFVSLNSQMLRWLGLSWYTTGLISAAQVDALVSAGFKARALELLATKFDGRECFGFKDPRTARLLGFWQKVFSEGQYAVRFLLVLRNPLEVAGSISRRNGFSESLGVAIWLAHVFPAIGLLKTEKFFIVDYSDFVRSRESARHVLVELTKFAEIELAEGSIEIFSEEFIKFYPENRGGNRPSLCARSDGRMADFRVLSKIANEVYDSIFLFRKNVGAIESAALEKINEAEFAYRDVSEAFGCADNGGLEPATICLYVKTSGAENFSESACLKSVLPLNGRAKRIQFSGGSLVDLDLATPHPVRLDPSESPIVFAVFSVGVSDIEGKFIWSSDDLDAEARGNPAVDEWFYDPVGVNYVGRTRSGTELFYGYSEDPQFLVHLPLVALQALRDGGALCIDIAAEAICVSPDGHMGAVLMKPIIDWLDVSGVQGFQGARSLRCLDAEPAQFQEQLAIARAEVTHHARLLEQVVAELAETNVCLRLLRAQCDEYERSLRSAEMAMAQAHESLNEARTESAEFQRQIYNMSHSFSWQFMAPIRLISAPFGKRVLARISSLFRMRGR